MKEKTGKRKNDLRGKKILITQPLIHPINGSTTVTLELAAFLQSLGAKVIVFTPTLASPSKDHFEKNNIRVDVAQDAQKYNIEDFDYIWVHSQIIPESIVEQLGEEHKKNPIFIFLHMSSFDWLPDEHPYIYGLEEKLSSLTLYICEEVRKSNQHFFKKEPEFDYYRNPAPLDFCRDAKKEKKLEKVLMISNYPPEELSHVKERLLARGIVVETMGEKGDKYELLSFEKMSEYDAVITIAKTAQYCLMSGVPVYLYGKFGGAGWLTEDNFERAKETNFCGSEGFSSKKTDEIVEEILCGYNEAYDFQQKKRKELSEDFALDKVLKRVFNEAKAKKQEIFSKDYLESVKAAQFFARIRFEEFSNVLYRDKRIEDLEIENKKLNAVVESRSVKIWLEINRMLRGRNNERKK